VVVRLVSGDRVLRHSEDNRAVLDWYQPRRRTYPWRRARPDPFRVLVSEVMLQQTQAARVVPAFVAFLERFPTVQDLAAAPRSDVIRAWAGLGYNRRAVALSLAARIIARDHDGRVPSGIAELRRLPGVGPYTAAAVASIAYGTPVPAIDTHVARIVARARLGVEAQAASARRIRSEAEMWVDPDAPGDWNQALMDLGRDVCRPIPRCERCPLARGCRFLRGGGRPGRSAPRQPRFEGSDRQVRGAVVRVLRSGRSVSLAGLSSRTGHPPVRVAAAVAALASEGLLVAGPAAQRGQPAGRVRLSDD
jgi:A/G-specific adenine glycosylase